MSKKIGDVKKVCGNCRYHNTYEYPDYVFCFARFSDRQNPVVSIFECCDNWEDKLQECFCLEDALKKKEKRLQDRVVMRQKLR